VRRLALVLLGVACGRQPESARAGTPPTPKVTSTTTNPRAPGPTASAASSAPAPLGALGDNDWTFSAPGQAPLVVPKAQRYEPPATSGERAPLVLVLHGLGASGKLAFDLLGLAALGEASHSMVLAPDGTFDAKRRRFWNADPACCNFEHAPIDDFARFSTLLETLRASGRVDETRVSVIGLSNGGFMAHQLACRMSERLAAVVSIGGAGPSNDPPCTVARPLAVLEIHGDSDDIVRYGGGSVFDDRAVPPHPSAQGTLAAWGKHLGCLGAPTVTAHYDMSPGLAGAETEALSYGACSLGSATLWTVHGGRHILSTRRLLAEVWKFLERQRK